MHGSGSQRPGEGPAQSCSFAPVIIASQQAEKRGGDGTKSRKQDQRGSIGVRNDDAHMRTSRTSWLSVANDSQALQWTTDMTSKTSGGERGRVVRAVLGLR